MIKIIRLYLQNRRNVWLALIIAIFCIAIIGLFNKAYEEQAKIDGEKIANRLANNTQHKKSDTIDYEKSAKSLTSGQSIDVTTRDQVQKVLEQFMKSVCENQVQDAYSYLTQECKKIYYPSVESFAQSYCSDIENRTYDFQLWATDGSIYIYQVKFIEELLSTGRNTSQNYLQDYVTVIHEQGVYQLNVNKLIQVKELNKIKEAHKIQIELKKVETYLDYENYEIEIKNSSDKDIILDPREKEDSVYVKNNDKLKIRALLYENKEEDLQVEAGETKTIKIKFNNTYNSKKLIKCIGFSNIIFDTEAYQRDDGKKDGTMEMEIYLR